MSRNIAHNPIKIKGPHHLSVFPDPTPNADAAAANDSAIKIQPPCWINVLCSIARKDGDSSHGRNVATVVISAPAATITVPRSMLPEFGAVMMPPCWMTQNDSRAGQMFLVPLGP